MSKININTCKVKNTNSGQVIWLSADCPSDYTFDRCIIKAEEYSKNTWITSNTYVDFSPAVNALETSSLNSFLPIGQIGLNPHTIYTVELHAVSNDPSVEPEIEIAYVSDVEFVYDCLFDKIVDISNDCCAEASDDLIRLYLTLYGHVSAMNYGRLDEAKLLYKRLLNCGCNCKTQSIAKCNCK